MKTWFFIINSNVTTFQKFSKITWANIFHSNFKWPYPLAPRVFREMYALEMLSFSLKFIRIHLEFIRIQSQWHGFETSIKIDSGKGVFQAIFQNWQNYFFETLFGICNLRGSGARLIRLIAKPLGFLGFLIKIQKQLPEVVLKRCY